MISNQVSSANSLPRRLSHQGRVFLFVAFMTQFVHAGLRIDAVCPGTINRPMVAVRLAKEPEAMKDIRREQPPGRLGESEGIAAAVVWFGGDGARFVIGHALVVDGVTVH